MPNDFQSYLEQVDDFGGDGVPDRINAHIGEEGVAWEIGPHPTIDGKDVFALALSNPHEVTVRVGQRLGLPFDGDRIAGVFGIPPRNWDRFFYFTGPDGHEIAVDGAGWRYGLSPAEGKVALTVQPDQDFGESARALVRILLVGELGEQNLHRFVARYDVGAASDMRPIEQLRRDFRNAVPGCIFADLF